MLGEFKDSCRTFIVNQNGKKLNIYNSVNGSLVTSMPNPPGLKSNQFLESTFETKNCQISQQEICIGDDLGGMFVKNLFTGKDTKLDSPHDTYMSHITITDDREWMYSCGQNHSVSVWNMKKRQVVHEFQTFTTCITYVEILRKRKIAACSINCTVKIFDVEKMVELKSLKDHADQVYELCHSSERNLFITCSRDKTSNLYDVRQMRKVDMVECGERLRSNLLFEERYLILGGEGNLFVFDMRKLGGRENREVSAHDIHRDSDIVGCIRGSFKDAIITGSMEHTIKIHSLEVLKETSTSEPKGLIAEIQETSPCFGMFLFNTKTESDQMNERDAQERYEYLVEEAESWMGFKVSIKNLPPISYFKVFF